MRARYYSPDMRRFVNADVIPGDIDNSPSLNRYAYVEGNPVSFTDPFGLSVLGVLGIMAIGGLIGAVIDGATSIVEQSLHKGSVNWAEVASDAAWGFASGAVAASPLGLVGKVVADSAISFASQMTEEYIYAENKEDGEWLDDVNYAQVGINVAVDALFSGLSGPGINSKNKLINRSEFLGNRIKREQRRANQKVAQKRIASINSSYMQDVIIDPLINTIVPNRYDVLHDVASRGVNKVLNAVEGSSRK